MPTTVLIVDDSTAMRRALRSFIELKAGDWKVCGEAENGAVAIEQVGKLSPAVVLLDLDMPVMNGLEAARQIARMAPNTAMVMLTMHSCDQLVKEAQAVGIRSVLSKSDAIAEQLLVSLASLTGQPRCA